MIEAYIDGLAEPSNPGLATYGFVIYRDGQRAYEEYDSIGDGLTNNYAEYHGLVRVLTRLLPERDQEVVVKSDSKLLVNQMKGAWRVKKGQYLERYAEARKLAAMFSDLRFEWIPREKNAEADMLSRLAYAGRSSVR